MRYKDDIAEAASVSASQRGGPRFKKARVAVDELNSFGRGWTRHMRCDRVSEATTVAWHTLGEIALPIRQRPELAEQNTNRIDNMRRCAELIDGWLLPPAGVFSMRRAIGEPTPQRGFRSGPIIIDGRLQEDIGGGICQVSTVLFNAALLGGLDILDKHNHSTDIWGENRMIDLGRDAAFAYALKDLKFRNSHVGPVVIRLGVADDQSTLVARVLSAEPLTGAIDVDSEVLEELLPEVPAGLAAGTAVSGWRVRTRRYHRVAGESRLTYEKLDEYDAKFTATSSAGR